MPDFSIDYSVLHEAKKDLYDLADRIAPTLKTSDFATLGKGDFQDAKEIFGNDAVAGAFRSLYRLSKSPMEHAVDRLKRLGDLFETVSNAYFDADSQIAEGMGVMGAEMGLDEWRKDKAAWDYRNEHADLCVPGKDGELPGFCSATDPGPPPVDQVIKTGNGEVHTHLTLDADNNVIKEETTVTSGGQTYTSTTTYTDGGKSWRTETTFGDGSTSVAETHITEEDGGGTMTITDPEGTKTEYKRDSRGEKWEQIGGPTAPITDADRNGDGIPDKSLPTPPQNGGATSSPEGA